MVLDDATISGPTETLEIRAQNSFLDGQNPVYGLGEGGDSGLFVVDATAKTLGLDPNSDHSDGTYQVNVTSTGGFGTANHRMVSVTVTGANSTPAVAPPTFDSSEFNSVTGVLRITFSETIDVTPATNVVPTKIHIRELGNYTGGITLSAGELVTAADGATISFTLTEPHRAAVEGLTVPELTVEPGAVRDISGSLIDGTFDASTAVFVDATSIQSRDNKPQGIAFSNDGTRMFVVGDQRNTIIEYTLSDPFDASTADFADAFSVSSQDGIPTDMAFSNDGTRMFVVGDVGNDINEYALSDPFDISTAVFTDTTFSVSSEGAYPTGMAFSNDGTRMFVVDNGDDVINEYALDAAFDISTADFTDTTFSVTTEEKFPLGMAFSNDGTRMFVVGSRGDDVNEYALSVPFDISTANFTDATALISSGDIASSGMAFSNDGAKMFVVTYFGDEIYEYALSSVYPVTVTDTPPPPQDTTDPVITINGDNPATITVDSTYTDAGATCNDAVDGTRDVTTTGDSFSTATTGTHTVTYTCSDTSNNEATATRTVNVEATPDTTDPVITINGDNPATITVDSTYTDAGATCNDAVDGTRDVTTTGDSFSTATTGTHTVTYTCSDTSNNEATATRTVNVEATPDGSGHNHQRRQPSNHNRRQYLHRCGGHL